MPEQHPVPYGNYIIFFYISISFKNLKDLVAQISKVYYNHSGYKYWTVFKEKIDNESYFSNNPDFHPYGEVKTLHNAVVGL